MSVQAGSGKEYELSLFRIKGKGPLGSAYKLGAKEKRTGSEIGEVPFTMQVDLDKKGNFVGVVILSAWRIIGGEHYYIGYKPDNVDPSIFTRTNVHLQTIGPDGHTLTSSHKVSPDAIVALGIPERGYPDRVNIVNLFEHYAFDEITGDQLEQKPLGPFN